MVRWRSGIGGKLVGWGGQWTHRTLPEWSRHHPENTRMCRSFHWMRGRFNKLRILLRGKCWDGIQMGVDRAEQNTSWLNVSLLSHLMFNTLFKVWHIPAKVWEVTLYHWPKFLPTQSKCFYFGLPLAFTVRIHRDSFSPFTRCVFNSRVLSYAICMLETTAGTTSH